MDNQAFLHCTRKSEGHDFFHISLVCDTQATQAGVTTTLSNTKIKHSSEFRKNRTIEHVGFVKIQIISSVKYFVFHFFKSKFQRMNSFIILLIFTSLLEGITFQAA